MIIRPVIIAVCLIGLIGLAVFFLRDRPPLNTKCLIRIHNGAAFVSGEPLPRHVMMSVADILHAAQIRTGFIAITSDPRVTFSRNIPEAIRQQLRNVVLNP
jgi:hypothetical protein